MPNVETSTPANTPEPIGPYHHVAKVGSQITIGGVAGVDPATGQLAGDDVGSQTRQILDSYRTMLASVGSDLEHVVHVSVFLGSLSDVEAMNEVGSIDEARTSRKFSLDVIDGWLGEGVLPADKRRLKAELPN